METFRREDYLFDLPEQLIAQVAVEPRDASRLMVAGSSGRPVHTRFSRIGDFLRSGDVLVLNQTKVMNARCKAQKENGTVIEVFVLDIQTDPHEVPVLLKPAKRVRPGTVLIFPNSGVRVETLRKEDQGKAYLKFASRDEVQRAVDADGSIPLPPYIKREQGASSVDSERYQTVYARDSGAVAAPTAGLHFTPRLLEDLKRDGIEICFVTHHVGIGTFKPVTVEDVREHVMEEERYIISDLSAACLNRAKKEGRRIIAVGTTSTRCLESNFDGGFHPGTFSTGSYLYPGYRFRALNALITNFHLPGSTLILLVSALIGRDRVLSLYREAVDEGYRFYSYGDAMLLIPGNENQPTQ